METFPEILVILLNFLLIANYPLKPVTLTVMMFLH